MRAKINRIQETFDYVTSSARIRGLRWAFCAEADREHKESKRQYMHTYCKRDTVCVAVAATELHRNNLLALMAHEVAHVFCGPNGSEYEADHVGSYFIGAPIRYDENAVQTIGPGVDRDTALKRYKSKA